MKEDGWYDSKEYKHFDKPVKKSTAYKIVSNPEKIKTHSFFPFLSFIVKAPKYQYDEKLKKKTLKTKEREICYCSHLDSHIYSYYSMLLSERYEDLLKEKNLQNNILAFRKVKKESSADKKPSKNKCNIDFAYDAFSEIKNYREPGVIALDFSKFFDTLDHKILKEQWCKVLKTDSLPLDHFKVFKSLTNFSKVNKNKLDVIFCREKGAHYSKICTIKEFREIVRSKKLIEINTEKGIPQGSPLSGLLSNIYMIDFDEKMKTYIDKLNGQYYRYCDDMLIIIPNISQMNKIERFAVKSIKNLKVTINEKKTELRRFKRENFYIKIKKKYLKNKNVSLKVKSKINLKSNLKTEEGKLLQYLGFVFNGEEVFIRASSISRFHSKMRRGIVRAKAHMRDKNKKREQKGYKEKSLFKKKLYEKYSHLGKSNFVTYSRRCKIIMDNSITIKKQMKKFDKTLLKRISK